MSEGGGEGVKETERVSEGGGARTEGGVGDRGRSEGQTVQVYSSIIIILTNIVLDQVLILVYSFHLLAVLNLTDVQMYYRKIIINYW